MRPEDGYYDENDDDERKLNCCQALCKAAVFMYDNKFVRKECNLLFRSIGSLQKVLFAVIEKRNEYEKLYF